MCVLRVLIEFLTDLSEDAVRSALKARGPMYFDETVTGVRKAIEEAGKAIKDRGADPLLKEK